jgi:hypothetical protein
MFSPQKNGIIFENEIHNFLSKTRYDLLLNETQIRKIDNTITAIDHLLVSNNIYFCFQDKRIKTNISNSNFNHFVKCVEKVSAKINHSCKIYAVYISFTDFSSIANKQFEEENVKYLGGNNIEYIKIIANNKDVIINYLHHFLHNNQVFLYDKTDCVML